MSAAAKMIERITARIPSLHASVARVYGADAFLFGIDFALADWAELCDEVGVHEYKRDLWSIAKWERIKTGIHDLGLGGDDKAGDFTGLNMRELVEATGYPVSTLARYLRPVKIKQLA